MHTFTQSHIILLFDWICLCTVSALYEDELAFIQEQIEFHVLENTSIGSIVTKDLRDQLQLSSEHQVRLGPGPLSSFFNLNNDYTLAVAKSLDIEGEELCHAAKSCCKLENGQLFEENYLFSKDNGPRSFRQNGFSSFLPDFRVCKLSAVVLANNGGSTPLKPVSRIVAIVDDVNDNEPVFTLLSRDVETSQNDKNPALSTNKIYIQFVEGPDGVRERVELPTAVDLDFQPENAIINYFISMKSDIGHAGRDMFDSSK